MATDGTVIGANANAAIHFGVPHAKLHGRSIFELVAPEVAAPYRDAFEQAVQRIKPLRFEEKQQGHTVEHTLSPVVGIDGNAPSILIAIREVSLMPATQRREQLAAELLIILNREAELPVLLQAVIKVISDYCRCEAVGIRLLNENGDIPYQAYQGFSDAFYQKESPLSIRSDECMCIAVVKGETNPAQPYFTPVGSFFSNGTTKLLATTDETNRGTTRNVCNAVGFESVALIPIRKEGRIIGLIHLADARSNMVPCKLVEDIESVSDIIGVAVQREEAREDLVQDRNLLKVMVDARTKALTKTNQRLRVEISKLFKAEKAARVAEREWKLIIDTVPDLVTVIDTKHRVAKANKATLDHLKTTAEELIGQLCYPVVHGTNCPPDFCPHAKVLKDGHQHSAEIDEPRLGGKFDCTCTPIFDETGRLLGSVHVAHDITAINRAQRTLMANEEKYRTVADFTYDWETWAGTDGRLLYVSPSCERVSGYGREEFLADPSLMVKIVHPDDRARVIEHTSLAMSPVCEPADIRWRIVTKAGEERWIHHVCLPIFTTDGTFLGRRASNRDITESWRIRQKLERTTRLLEAIREAQSLFIEGSDSQEVFSSLLRSLVMLTESQYGFLDEVMRDDRSRLLKRNLAISDIAWDKASRQLFQQMTKSELVFQDLSNLAGLPALKNETVIANDPPHDPRAKGLMPGHPPINSFMGLPARIHGELVGVAGVANRPGGYRAEEAAFLDPFLSTCASIIKALRTHGEERRLLKSLRESEDRYRALFERTLEPLSLCSKGQLIDVNASWLALHGLSIKSEAIGQPVLAFVAPEDREAHQARRTLVFEDEEVRTFEERDVRRDGSVVFVEVQSSTMVLAGEKCVISALRDISTRHATEAALRKSEAEQRKLALENATLADKAQAEAKTNALLLQEVNHRVKNNLAALIGILCAERKYAGQEKPATYIASLDDLIHRLESIAKVHSLLSANAWGPIRVSDIVRKVTEGILRSALPAIEVRFEMSSSRIEVPPERATSLALIVSELVTNIVKHIPKSDTPTILRVVMGSDGENHFIELRDNGPGFPETVLMNQKSSVGLYLVRNLLGYELSGRLELRNENGAVAKVVYRPARKEAKDTKEREN